MSAPQLGEAIAVVAKLHEGKITAHWLWVAITRVAAGEPVDEVMRDYGWVREVKP